MEPFKKNDFPTLGIEEELHLIDTETAELTPAVDEVMALLDSDFRERVCYELLQCVLETRTGVYETVDDLIKETANGRTTIAESCKKLNVNLVAAGCHPFSDWRKRPFVDNEHYQWVRDNCGYIEENWWKAIRYGTNTDMIEPETGEIISISEQLSRFVDLVAPKAKELHAEHHIDFVRIMIEQGNESEIQRALYKELNGDLRALEKELARKTLDFSV